MMAGQQPAIILARRIAMSPW